MNFVHRPSRIAWISVFFTFEVVQTWVVVEVGVVQLELRGQLEVRLREALKLDHPYQDRFFAQTEGTPAAVLVLLAFSNQDADPRVLVTLRTEKVETHKGQMAFLGGMTDPQDTSPEMTALREAEEEAGVPPAQVSIVGSLPTLWTVTRFVVSPIVGVLTLAVEDLPLKLNEHEIAEAVWLRLSDLANPATYRRELLTVGQLNYRTDVFEVGPHRIWGATGSMLKNLIDRLSLVSRVG